MGISLDNLRKQRCCAIASVSRHKNVHFCSHAMLLKVFADSYKENENKDLF